MSGNFFRGTTVDQDARYNNAEKKLLSKMSFAPVLATKVSQSVRGCVCLWGFNRGWCGAGEIWRGGGVVGVV